MVNKKKLIDSSDNLFTKIKELVSENIGRHKIMRIFGLKESQARKLINKAKDEISKQEFAESCKQPMSKENYKIFSASGIEERDYGDPDKYLGPSYSQFTGKEKKRSVVDEYRGLLDQGFDSYDIARIRKTTPDSTVRMIEKLKGNYDPAKEWVMKAACRGVLLSVIEKEFNIKGVDRAKEILQATFENCFVIETATAGDVLLTPVYSSAREIEELRVPGKDKRFKYYVSPEEDYLYVKFDDDIEADHLEIYSVGDLHIGADHCRESLVEFIVSHIESKDNAFILCTGDIIDQITPYSVGDPQEMYLSNTEQIKKAAKVLKSVSHKILDWVYSNHDDGRSEKTSRTRSGEVIAAMLGTPYFRQGVTIDLEWRGIRKTLFHVHGFANGKAFEESRIIAEIKKSKSFMNYEVNAWVSGHVHRSLVRRLEHDSKVVGRGITGGNEWVLVNGSASARQRSYGRRAGYGPNPQDIVYYMFDDKGNDCGKNIMVSSG